MCIFAADKTYNKIQSDKNNANIKLTYSLIQNKLTMKINKLLALVGFGMMTTGAWAQTDVTSTYLTNAGFESCAPRTDNLAASGSAAGDNYEDAGWTLAQSSAWSSSAVVAYGGSGQVNGASAPSADNLGNTGNALGVSVGWGGTNRYLSTTAVTLPAGHYVLTVNAYNNLSGVTQFKSVNGFVPTSGSPYLSTKTSFAYATWVTDVITFNLTEATEGKFQIGGTAISGGSGSNAKVFFDNLTLVYTDPLKAAKDALQTEIDKAKLCDAKEGLADAISTAEGVLATATTQTELEEALATLQAADKDAVLRYENGLTDATATAPVTTSFVVNGTFDNNINGWSRTGTYQNNKTANNQKGAFTGNFYENWNGSAQANKMYQTISNIPNGTYRLNIAAFVNTLADPNESQYVFANDDKTYLTTGEPTAYEVYTVVTNNQIEIGLEQTTATANWMGLDNVSLNYYGAGDVIDAAKAGAHKVAWDEALAAAKAAIANEAYANVTGSEKVALAAEIAKVEPSTADDYDAATEALNAATATFTAAKSNYDALVAEIAYAQTISVSTTDAKAAINDEATAASVFAAAQALKLLEYTTINSAYANDVTSLLGTWAKGNYDTTSGQGYVGSESYFDKWSGSATDLSSSATVTLPAGKYVVKVAGRGVSATTMNLSVKVGEADAVSTPFLMSGDTGKGIDTAGTTNFSEEGTYSNNNTGRGWQYRYITFETTGEEVTIAISGHLNAGTWQSFYAPVLLCDDATYAPIAVDAAKADLQAAINAAPAVLTANIGDGVFQIAEAGVTTYSSALAAAQTAHDADDATIASIKQAQADLAAAIEAYNALEVNAPDANKAYNVLVATEGHAKLGNALLLAPGATTANNPTGYTMTANFAPNANLNQGVKFTKVSGNNYIISFETAEGTAYLTYGTTNGSAASWKDSQIQATTDAEKKGEFLIKPSTTEGAFNIYNTLTNSTIACQAGGNIYTEAGNADFTLGAEEVAKASITINTTAAGWGTVMLPFAVASLPDGVKAYSCAAVADDVLTLEPVTELAANTPYIIEGAWNETLTGDAKGTALTYTAGLLTGVYADTEAVAGSYVLQDQADGLGFYKVEEVKPTVGANRAYLTYEAPAEGGEVKFFRLGDTTTAVNTVKVAGNSAVIYNLAGQRVNGAQKGIYIVNGKKVIK